jgi:hypothetical protein
MIKKIFILLFFLLEELFIKLFIFFRRLPYKMKIKVEKKKPYFNKYKYLDSMKDNEEHDNARILISNDRSVWWMAIDDEELIQVSKNHFQVKNLKEFKYVRVNKYWIEWR